MSTMKNVKKIVGSIVLINLLVACAKSPVAGMNGGGNAASEDASLDASSHSNTSVTGDNPRASGSETGDNPRAGDNPRTSAYGAGDPPRISAYGAGDPPRTSAYGAGGYPRANAYATGDYPSTSASGVSIYPASDSNSGSAAFEGSNSLDDPNSLLAKRVIYYPTDIDTISEQDKPVVQAHAEYLAEHPDRKVRLEGNSDERGSSEYNLALGQRRADGVKKRLRVGGVREEQIESISYGEEKAVGTTHDESSWSQNRRTDLIYFP